MTLVLTVAERHNSLAKYDLKIDRDIRNQEGQQPLPFMGMDKSTNQMCEMFMMNRCQYGNKCSYRHIRGDKMIVCKFWLRGLCKKGDDCEFLHQYDMVKMPVCYFYSNFGRCDNDDCMYQHISAEMRIQACPWYARGFCKHGATCKRRHVRKVLCPNFLTGFCPDGPDCEFEHPSFELPLLEGGAGIVRCHFCGVLGHKSNVCDKNPHRLPPEIIEQGREAIEMAKAKGIHDPRESLSKSGQPMSRNFLEARPTMQQDLELNRAHKAQDETVYSIPTMGSNGTDKPVQITRPVPVGNQQPFIPYKKRHTADMGYGDGEEWSQSDKQRFQVRGPYYQNTAQNNSSDNFQRDRFGQRSFRPMEKNLDYITCFKCLENGHYANQCPTFPRGEPGPGYSNYFANKNGGEGPPPGHDNEDGLKRNYEQAMGGP